MLELGQLMCFRTTGELALVVSICGGGQVQVRRPVMTHENGISHSIDEVFEFELETVEEHLRHEAKEMVLKIQIQEEMTAEMEKAKKPLGEKSLVN